MQVRLSLSPGHMILTLSEINAYVLNSRLSQLLWVSQSAEEININSKGIEPLTSSSFEHKYF